MSKPTIIHLLSGGVDSVTMLYDLHAQGCSIRCLLADYKQPHVQELQWAKLHCHRLGIMFTTIELPDLGGMRDGAWVVPNRNAILLSLGVSVAIQTESHRVTIGCNRDDSTLFQDCRSEFMDAFNGMLRSQECPVVVEAPYIGKSKAWVKTQADKLGVKMHETWSCYRGGKKPCGTCPACKTLEEACGK